MSLDLQRVLTVARREFITTIRRKAFLLTLVGTPAYFVLVTMLSSGTAIKEGRNALKEFTTLGVVDSAGMLADADSVIVSRVKASDSPFAKRGLGGAAADVAPAQTFRTRVVRYPDQATAERALRAAEVSQVLVIPSDYVVTGHVSRYARSGNLFSGADGRAVGSWLTGVLLRGRVDSLVAARVAKPTDREEFYTLDKTGRFVPQGEDRDVANVMFPMFFALLLGLCLTIGGQYLLQGISEEKETRILESLLCTVSPEELMTGKLIGLGSVGLLVVAVWFGLGLMVMGPALAMLHITIPPLLLLAAVAYFLLGYLFYGSVMIGIGGVTNNMREAQQFSVWFTFANMAPLVALMAILSRPSGAVAVGLSLFPPTAATAMLLRLAVPNSSVPAWQLAVSYGLLAAASWFTLRGAARVFRIGMLMYGKTPNLPEILRWARQR